MNKKFIHQIPFFSSLTDKKLEIVVNEFKPIQFKKGDVVIKQGDEGNGMYVIIFGEVNVIQYDKPIAKLSNEDFFGEMSLIANEPRSATIQVTSDDLSTLFLSKESFKKIQSQLNEETRKEILRRITENYS